MEIPLNALAGFIIPVLLSLALAAVAGLLAWVGARLFTGYRKRLEAYRNAVGLRPDEPVLKGKIPALTGFLANPANYLILFWIPLLVWPPLIRWAPFIFGLTVSLHVAGGVYMAVIATRMNPELEPSLRRVPLLQISLRLAGGVGTALVLWNIIILAVGGNRI